MFKKTTMAQAMVDMYRVKKCPYSTAVSMCGEYAVNRMIREGNLAVLQVKGKPKAVKWIGGRWQEYDLVS